MNQGAFEEFYFGTPIVTRVYMTVCFVTTLAVYLDVVNVLQLYLNFELVANNWEVRSAFSLFSSLFLFFPFC